MQVRSPSYVAYITILTLIIGLIKYKANHCLHLVRPIAALFFLAKDLHKICVGCLVVYSEVIIFFLKFLNFVISNSKIEE